MTEPAAPGDASRAGRLAGRCVLVTRAGSQAGELTERLEREGALVLECPTIRFEEPDDWGAADRAIASIGSYDWVVFTSANGVRCFFERMERAGQGPRARARARIAAIGPATERALSDKGVRVDLMPDESVAESLLEAMRDAGAAAHGAKVLIPRAQVAREVLPEALAQAGAEVDVAPVYRTSPEMSVPGAVAEALEDRRVDVVTFTSASTVRAFARLMAPLDVTDVLRGTTVACIGPVTAEAAGEARLDVAVIPERSTVPDLVEALASRVGPRREATPPERAP